MMRNGSNHPAPQPTRDLQTLQADLRTHGYCLIKDGLTPTQIATARQRVMDQAQAEVEVGTACLMGDRLKPNQQVRNLLAKGDIFVDLVTNPVMLELVESVLGRGFLLSSFTGNLMQPGNIPQRFHWDQTPNDAAMGFQADTNPVMAALSAGYALDAFTKANGGTR